MKGEATVRLFFHIPAFTLEFQHGGEQGGVYATLSRLSIFAVEKRRDRRLKALLVFT